VSAPQDDLQDKGQGPAGPVAGDGASSSQAAGESPSPTPPAGDGDQVEQDIAALLSDAQRERDEYLELARRTKADFENFRKRMSSEVAAAGARGKATVVGELVHVVDNLERALDAAGIDPDQEGSPEEPLAQGVLLTYREVCGALQRNEVEAVNPKGERFDPNVHEALSTLAADGAESGTVVEVMQKGYRLGEQLIRPARVVVAE
jgi:molecular chaperone GrpE